MCTTAVPVVSAKEAQHSTLSAICLCWGALLTTQNMQELLHRQKDNNMGQACEAWLKAGSAFLAAITMRHYGTPHAQQPTQRQVLAAWLCTRLTAILGSHLVGRLCYKHH